MKSWPHSAAEFTSKSLDKAKEALGAIQTMARAVTPRAMARTGIAVGPYRTQPVDEYYDCEDWEAIPRALEEMRSSMAIMLTRTTIM